MVAWLLPAILGGVSALSGVASARSAANAQTQASDAQLQLGREQNALARDIYNTNIGRTDAATMAALGYVPGQAAGTPQGPLAPGQGGYSASTPSGPSWAAGSGSTGGIIGNTLNQQLAAGQRQYDLQTGAARDMRQAAMGFARDARQGIRQTANQTLRDQTATAQQVYDDQRQGFRPYQRAGNRAQNALAYELGLTGGDRPRNYEGFRATPGYEFMRNEGMRGIEGSAAAGGDLMSGRTLRALNQYGTGLANQTYGQHLDRLTGTAGTGLATAGALAGAAGQYGNAVMTAQGNRGANVINALANYGQTGVNVAGQQGQMNYGAAGALGTNAYNAYGTAGANTLGALGNFASGGQAAGNSYLAASGNAANFMGNALANMGDARAAGAIGIGNAIQGGIQNGLGLWNYYNSLKPPQVSVG